MNAGDRLGSYEIVALIGKGGMGDVYRAHDSRLGRDVAIKICDERFNERFEREARAIAALNHPNICQLYDVGLNYLVMELVEGTPLKGPLPVKKVLEYAAQILEALDAAHRKGITHRDLKPANILITKQGIKLLDFGLARMNPGPQDATLTRVGEVMGTPAYMSPEQWEGKPGDARSDIYAFGCVLYEMLTGKRAAQDRAALEPVALEWVLAACLEKEPDERWQSVRDLRRTLQLPTAPAPARNPWRERAAWITAAASLSMALFLALRPAPPPAAGGVVRLSINPPEKMFFTGQNTATVGAPDFVLSPDGRSIVFAAAAPGARSTLWHRSLETETASLLAGTEGAELPFWSPDNRWVGYFADGKLKKIPPRGGPSQVVANALNARGASWGSDETILFGSGDGGIFRVSSSGGTGTRVTELDATRQEGSHRFPQWLPNGRHFLFSVRSGLADQAGVYAASLDGKIKKLLIRGLTNALYASDYLFFMDGDTLMGQAFDANLLELSGQPFVVQGRVGRSSTGNGSFSACSAGVLAHADTLSQHSRLTWFDRSGNPSESVGPPGDYTDFRLSPDQTRLAASVADTKTGFADIWLTDLSRGSTAPFTFGPAVNASPVWSPDGTRVAFRTSRNGGMVEFYRKSAGGGGKEEPILPEEAARDAGVQSTNLYLSDWSPDGRYLLFSTNAASGWDLWLLPLAGAPKPVSLLSAPGDQLHGNFSPDGRLVAYSSSESGKFEVHVQTFPLSDRQWTISTVGGTEPRWRADGREIYYLSEDRNLMVVPVGPGPSFGTPRQLFLTRVPGGVNALRTHYVPSRDGQRFLLNTQSANPVPTPITIVLNWTAGLKK
jgi:eukaryotic-like serine/threonine-protein kinase